MTTHSWTTSADLPPAAWAAFRADLTTLLAAWGRAGGAAVTGPDGTGAPQLGDDGLGFAVTLPGKTPLVVAFARAAGAGQVTTNATSTDGLVALALTRAARHWGPLLAWTSAAGVTARALAAGLEEALYGPGDRALGGQPVTTPDAVTRAELVARAALGRVAAGPAATHPLGLPEVLGALIAELTAEAAGYAAAATLLTPAVPVPAPVAPAA